MLFEFKAAERSRFEDMLYWLRRCGYVVELYYSEKEATITARRKIDGRPTLVDASFRRNRLGNLVVDALIRTPQGKALRVDRITEVIHYARTSIQ